MIIPAAQRMALALALIGLAACGQKGPLYLPGPGLEPPQAEQEATPDEVDEQAASNAQDGEQP